MEKSGNGTAARTKRRHLPLYLLLLIALIVAVTAVVVALRTGRITGFYPALQIDLLSDSADAAITPYNASAVAGISTDEASSRDEAKETAEGTSEKTAKDTTDGSTVSAASGSSGLSYGTSDFSVRDENGTVWNTDTTVEIFKISYEGADGSITVNSSDGDKVIAPGTANDYRFELCNTGTTSLGYTMEISAWFGNEKYAIPVQAKLVNDENGYIVGSEDSWADVLELDGAFDGGAIYSGKKSSYTLSWQWPFDGDDEYDTLLGDLSVDEDITLTIDIRTTAYTTSLPGERSGAPQTGDMIKLILIVAFVCLCVIAVQLILRRMKKTDGEDEAETENDKSENNGSGANK